MDPAVEPWGSVGECGGSVLTELFQYDHVTGVWIIGD